MVNLQKEAVKIQKLREAMERIESDITLSLHHWSTELEIPVQDLQRAWARHNFEKRKNGGNDAKR